MKPAICAAILTVAASTLAAPLSAQEVDGAADDTLTIDILVPVPTTADRADDPSCDADAPVKETGDTIVICGRPIDDEAFLYSGDAEAAEDRHARETAFAGTIPPPDVAGPGIFRGPATVGGMCGFGLNPCPAPPALMIDVRALPAPPEGSDAQRVARGLAPQDDPDAEREGLSDFEREELGLPPRTASVPDSVPATTPVMAPHADERP
ncbi:MAG: hypothetical protein WA948_07830 [Pontixanthobacter sp.]